jgi:hypothetical protein
MYSYRAAAEVLRMYKLKLDFPRTTRVLLDKTASSGPVGAFYWHLPHGGGRSRLLQHGCEMRLGHFGHIADECVCPSRQMPRPSIVFACDTAPEMMTVAPAGRCRSTRTRSIWTTPND